MHNDWPGGAWPPFGESWAGAAERQPALKKIKKTPRAKISANYTNLLCKTLLGGEKLFLFQVNTSGRLRLLWALFQVNANFEHFRDTFAKINFCMHFR